MRELLVFPTEIEQQGMVQLIHDNFPLVEFCEVKPDPPDIMVAMKIVPIRPAPFIHWAIETERSGVIHAVSYCYNLSLALSSHPMPRWLVREIMADSYLRQVFQLSGI